MTRRLLVVCVAIAMLTVFLPVTSATHFSAGFEDTVGTGAEETPDNPSVEGDQTGADETPYGVGTKTDECYDPEAEVSPGEAQEAATSSGFCGQLAYNEDTSFEILSPPDQDFPRDDLIGTFDVQRTWYFGDGVATCLPMCDDPGQNETWNVVHTVGNAAGLTDGPQEAHNNEDSRFNVYNAEVQLAHAPGVVQRSTGLWDMNGYIIPAPGLGGSFVGFVFDADGNVVDNRTLENKITKAVEDGELSSDTEVGICGYTPDRQFQSTGEQGFCESPLLWVPPDDGRTTFDGYDDPCQSPAYVCGPTTGGHWQSEAVGLVGAYGGRYQGEYMRHHWVIAPNQPDCPAMEPGFDFSGDGPGQDAFIAHDLDVYTPPQDIAGAPSVVSTENLYSIDDESDSYAAALTEEQPSVPGVPTDEIEAAAEPVRKGDVLEPNHVGAEDTAIDDSSRLEISEGRTLGLGCSELGSTETAATNDPWVNRVDNEVVDTRSVTIREPVVEARVPYTGGGIQTETVGLYGTQDGQHDDENDPTVDLYSTSGNVGVFTDKNDDGDYEIVVGPNNAASGFGAGVYSGGNIQATGAYPMLWDQHVTVENGEASVDTNSGCSGPSSLPFGEIMDKAGYGPNTGLAQAIYLKEPATFTDLDVTDPQLLPFAGGNNIYVFLNNAGRDLWDEELDDGTDDFQLSEEVDTLVEDLRDFVVAEHGADANSLRVVQPGAQMGFDSDFTNQCGTDTGGYGLDLGFTHTCETDCSGDSIATAYVFEVARDDGTIGGGPIPFFQVDGETYDFGSGVHSWHDIDPFDGDNTRNDQRLASPPTG